MPALKLLNLLALASVAIVALSSPAVHVNALAADRAQVARQVHGHDAVAKRKRSDYASSSASGSCKPRPSSSLAAPTTSTLAPASAPAPTSALAPTSTPAPTSSAPLASTSAATSGSSGTKWGLAWGADSQYLSNFDFPSVGYAYTWSPSIPSGLPSGISGMPMLWGYNQVTQFQSTVVAGYANYVLGMNEPNEPSQSNMSPQDGFTMWMTYINPLKDQGYYLISPACTNDQSGLDWYQQFFDLCHQTSDCHVDGIAFHAYTTSAQDLIDYANTLYTTYGLEVWVTEFADQNFSGTGSQATMDQVWDYAGQVVNFVESTAWLRAAFPFGIMDDLQGVNTDNSLLTSDGQPTSLAYYYFG